MIKNIIIKNSLLFGLLNAGLCIAFFLILYFTGIVPLGNKKLPDLGFHIIFVAGAIWQFKRNSGGFIHTWEALSTAYLANFIATVLIAIFLYIFVKFIDPTTLQRYIDAMVDLLQKSKNQHIDTFGEPSFKATLAQVKLTTAGDIFWDEVSKKTFFMIIPIFIMSAVFRKIKPNIA